MFDYLTLDVISFVAGVAFLIFGLGNIIYSIIKKRAIGLGLIMTIVGIGLCVIGFMVFKADFKVVF